jgi:hypothetical protein
LYLKFADLGVEGKGVEEHGADEGNVSGLAAHTNNFLKGHGNKIFTDDFFVNLFLTT